MAHLVETEDKIILLPHIPKTGGISACNYLEQNFDFIFGQSERPDIPPCSELTIKINGHTTVTDCQRAMVDFYGDILSEKETVLISVIRNPWSWWKSWFHFIPILIKNNDNDIEIEQNELYHNGNVDADKFFSWMEENKERCFFKERCFNTINPKEGLVSHIRPKVKKYDQMINWTKCEIFDFDKSYTIQTHEQSQELPKIFSELGFDFETQVSLENESKSIDYTNEKFYNDNTREIVENFHKEDIEKYGFKWETCKDML